MDVISHGLWGGLVFGRENKSRFFLSLLFGVFPDVFAFSYTFVKYLILGRAITGPISYVPEYVFRLYNISHSLIVASIVVGIILLIWGKKGTPALAWPIHILFDIPTHDLVFFPTPFIWPFNTPFFDGIPWSTPWVFLMNTGVLVLLYAVWKITKKKKSL